MWPFTANILVRLFTEKYDIHKYIYILYVYFIYNDVDDWFMVSLNPNEHLNIIN